MKALSMLDHVMLWIARIFAVWILATSFIGLFYYPGNLTDHRLITEVITDVVAFLWLISLWLLDSKITRLCLGLSAGFFLVRVAWIAPGLLGQFHHMGPSYQARFLLMFGTSILGVAAMIWVSLRPPQNSKTSNGNPLLPQSC